MRVPVSEVMRVDDDGVERAGETDFAGSFARRNLKSKRVSRSWKAMMRRIEV